MRMHVWCIASHRLSQKAEANAQYCSCLIVLGTGCVKWDCTWYILCKQRKSKSGGGWCAWWGWCITVHMGVAGGGGRGGRRGCQLVASGHQRRTNLCLLKNPVVKFNIRLRKCALYCGVHACCLL